MILKMDGDEETFTLAQFLEANSEPGVDPLDDEDVEALRNLNVGEEHALGAGGGFTLITRVA
jgi:hypothetical protein